MDITLHFNSYIDALELHKELTYKLDYLMTDYKGDFSFSNDNYDIDLIVKNATEEEINNLTNNMKGGNVEIDINDKFDRLVELELLQRQTVDVCRSIYGDDCLNHLIYYATGYRDWEQWQESEEN